MIFQQNSIVPYNGKTWQKDTTEYVVISADYISGCSGPPSFENCCVNKSGNIVHVNIYDDLTFATTGGTATVYFNLPYQSSTTQASCGTVMFSTITGTATGDTSVNVSSVSAGKVSQTGNIITCNTPAFSPSMIGGKITFIDGTTATINGFTSSTVMSTVESQTVGIQDYIIDYSYGFSYLVGPALSNPTNQLTIDFTYFIST